MSLMIRRALAGGPPQPTEQQARAAGLRGANLRCNRCGMWGAMWWQGQRPGWGALAVCDPHGAELEAELIRHDQALTVLRAVNFEQPHPWERS